MKLLSISSTTASFRTITNFFSRILFCITPQLSLNLNNTMLLAFQEGVQSFGLRCLSFEFRSKQVIGQIGRFDDL